MFKALYNHVYKQHYQEIFTNLQSYSIIFTMIKKGKIKIKQYMQINRNNDLLLLNLLNKYVLGYLIKTRDYND